MFHYKYLVIGGGMAADAAIVAIRSADSKATIGLVSSESVAPYNRPPLSKGLWKDESLESIWRKTEDQEVELHLDRTVVSLDPMGKRVTDNLGKIYTYEKLLLAVGGIPKRLPFGEEQIIYFRTLQDYERLRALCKKGTRFALIGGGFIASELAAALTISGKQAMMLFPGDGIGSHMFPKDLSLFLNGYYRKKGVKVFPHETVTGLVMEDGFPVITTENEQTFSVDGVVAGVGIEPNIELAEMARLKIRNGIIVDEFLQTSAPDIYAAGDAVSFYNPAVGQYMRVEHEDNANTMGQFAGRNMAGDPMPYHHLPYFYSDLFELSYQAVGELDSRLEMVSDWKEPFQEGFVYYLKDQRVRGVLLWNVTGKQLEAARQLIAEPGPFQAKDLIGRLPFSAKQIHQRKYSLDAFDQ